MFVLIVYLAICYLFATQINNMFLNLLFSIHTSSNLKERTGITYNLFFFLIWTQCYSQLVYISSKLSRDIQEDIITCMKIDGLNEKHTLGNNP